MAWSATMAPARNLKRRSCSPRREANRKLPVQADPPRVANVAPEGASGSRYTRSGASNPLWSNPYLSGQP
jgi:hypothetical protein